MSFPLETAKVADDVHVFRWWLPTPIGHLAFSSYLILGKEPILVDTQSPIVREAFFDAVFKLVEPKDVRWIYLTHDDRDHSGNLMQALERCPNSRFLTPTTGMSRMVEEFAMPMDRYVVINPGERLEANGRTYSLLRPPVYDSPATVALFDPKSGILFSSDSFGAFIPKPAQTVADVPAEDFTRGFATFQSANSPWSHLLPGTRLLAEVSDAITSLSPKAIASGHGPVAYGNAEQLVKLVASAAEAPPFKGPSHKEFEAIMAQAAQAAPPA